MPTSYTRECRTIHGRDLHTLHKWRRLLGTSITMPLEQYVLPFPLPNTLKPLAIHLTYTLNPLVIHLTYTPGSNSFSGGAPCGGPLVDLFSMSVS